MKPSLPFLISMLCVSSALAEPPAPPVETGKAAAALVEEQLVAPLSKAQAKRKRFSRAAPVPTERRVRVVDEVLQTDARGKQFLRFVIDERLAWNEEGTWNEGALRGCAYPEEGQVFVQQGDQHFPARSALGKREAPAPHACRPAPTAPARLASTTGS